MKTPPLPAQASLLLNYDCAATVQVLPHSDGSKCFPNEGIIAPSMRAVGAQQDKRETYEWGQEELVFAVGAAGS